jgi:hypothetical protein
MVRFFGGGASDGLGQKSDEKSRFGFLGSVLGKFDEGRRSESDLTRRGKVKKYENIVAEVEVVPFPGLKALKN